MGRLKKIIKDYPIATYYFLTFLISWGGLIIVIGGLNQFTPNQKADAPFLNVYLITVAGPCIAGIILTGLCEGIKGYHEFLSRLFKWRVKAKWYLVALLIAPITVFTALCALSPFSPVFQAAIFSSVDNPVASAFGISGGKIFEFLPFVFTLGLINGFIEELGWTGFVTPRLNLKSHLVITGLSIGFMWGLWHLFSNYLGSAAEAGAFSLPLYIAVLLFSFLPPFRILMVWVYAHTESLLIGILMHASLNVFWILSMPSVLTVHQRVAWYITWAVILWALVGIINKFEKGKKSS